MINYELNIKNVLEFLLQEKYFSEFELIDGLNQHPLGFNFYDWLYSEKLITKNELDKINKQIMIEIQD